MPPASSLENIPVTAKPTAQQCQGKNTNKQSLFSICETLQADLAQTKLQLQTAQKLNCTAKHAAKPNPDAASYTKVDGPCSFPENLALTSLGDEMKKCVLEHCGTIKLNTNPADYQACLSGIELQTKTILDNLTKRMQTAARKNSDPCTAPRQRMDDINQQLNAAQCHQYPSPLIPDDCST